MPPDPSRATTPGRVFNDLRNMARREGRSTDELLLLYVLERFLYRVSRSRYADKLVLKGGVLLAVLGARRATRDADLLALQLGDDQEDVMAWVAEIVSIDVDDGVVFAIELARAQPIRDDHAHAGVRVIVPAQVGKARVKLALDVSFGDPITPDAIQTRFPQLLGRETFPLLGYPIATVLAEKIVTNGGAWRPQHARPRLGRHLAPDWHP